MADEMMDKDPALAQTGSAEAHITPADVHAAHDMAAFVQECPSMFHMAAAVRRRLDEAGFAYLPESKPWEVRRGGRYYTVRNNSSIIAFKVGAKLDAYRFQLTASHSDSPTYKVKAAPELSGPSGYMRLNVEAYGGVMDHTWFDRPLSVAGRVLVRSGNRVESRLIAPDADLLIIPRVPIHLDREANSRFSPNRAVDLCPVMSAGELGPGSFDRLVAQGYLTKTRPHDDQRRIGLCLADKGLAAIAASMSAVWRASKECSGPDAATASTTWPANRSIRGTTLQ